MRVEYTSVLFTLSYITRSITPVFNKDLSTYDSKGFPYRSPFHTHIRALVSDALELCMAKPVCPDMAAQVEWCDFQKMEEDIQSQQIQLPPEKLSLTGHIFPKITKQQYFGV